MRLLLLALLLCPFSTHAVTIEVLNVRAETCGNANGSMSVTAYGGQAPYTFNWTGPNGYTATGLK